MLFYFDCAPAQVILNWNETSIFLWRCQFMIKWSAQNYPFILLPPCRQAMHWLWLSFIPCCFACHCFSATKCLLAFNSLAPQRCGSNFKSLIAEHMLWEIFEYFLWNCSQVIATTPLWWSINIGPSSLVLSGNKPLVEPMLRDLYLHMVSLGHNELILYSVKDEIGMINQANVCRSVISHNDLTSKATGGRLNKKDGLTRYGDSHVKDKTS